MTTLAALPFRLRLAGLVLIAVTAAGSAAAVPQPEWAPGPAASITADTTRPVLLNPAQVSRAIERAYPPLLRDAGVTGVVRVRMRVTREGVPADLEVAGSTDPRLSAGALQAMRAARFRPAAAGGQPIEYRMIVPVRFEAAPEESNGGIGVTGLRAVLNPDEVTAALRREYPPLLRDAGVTGEATLELAVRADGSVERVQAVWATHPELGAAAERAFRVARFRAADGAVVIRLPARFGTEPEP